MFNRKIAAPGGVFLAFVLVVYLVMAGPGGDGIELGSGNPVDTNSARAAEKDRGSQPPAPAPKALFEGWKKPALAIILSGEQHGYIEPCGCSLNQLGGLSRRADLLRQIAERGWPATAFDVGGLVNNPTRQQGKFKFDMILKCLADMHYAGVAIGVEELQLSFDFLARPEQPPFLGANLILFGDPQIVGGPLSKRIVTVGNLKVGVTAIFGPSLKGLVAPGAQDGAPADFEVLDPAQAIRKALAQLEADKPDLLILLSHAKYDETKKLAESFPQFDIVVTAGGAEDPEPKPKFIGKKTLLVAPGQKGKHVPVVGYYPGGGPQRLKYELVDLDEKRFKDSPKIVEHMRFYQNDMLKERNLVANERPIDDPRNVDPITGLPSDNNPFVGAKHCGECHKSAWEVWQSTKHAQATESLKTGRPGENKGWINRMFDPECVACHVTGWDPKKFIRYKSGFTGEQSSPHLVGQQCENCHGPGGRHVELERLYAKNQKSTDELAAWRKFQRLNKKTAFDLCAKCHDGDNDPKFDSKTFDEYWEQVAHPGRD